MPVEQKFRSLGVEVSVQVPATVDEFDQNAKSVGACLREAVSNVVYRGVLAEFRDAFCDAVEEKSGVERKRKDSGKKTEAGEVILIVDESEGEYLRRVRAEKGWTEDNSVLQSIANEVATELVFDASATEPKERKPKKVPAKYLTAAQRIITNGTQSKYDRFGIVWTGDAAKDAETLAWKIKAEVEEAEKAKLEAAYG